jgi:hypothetical protein
MPIPQQGISSSQSALAHPFESLMKVRGWVKYEPTSANTPRVLYEAEDGTRACRWIWYNLLSVNPQVKGTDGPNCWVYHYDLHAEPQQSNPNFDRAKGFANDHCQVFFPEFSSWHLVDRALGELGDMGLTAEVNRLHACLHREQDALDAKLLQAEAAYSITLHYLVRARAPSRVGTQIFKFPIDKQQSGT